MALSTPQRSVSSGTLPPTRSVADRVPSLKRVRRSATELVSQYTNHIPSEETNILYDKNDEMVNLLREQIKNSRRKLQLIDSQKKKTAQNDFLYDSI